MSVKCQFCDSHANIFPVLDLGYMPPPNDMRRVGEDAKPQTWLPTELWFCRACELAQLGYVPDRTWAFPEDYPYTSGMTPALKRNFQDLAVKCIDSLNLKPEDLVVDIGSNDGTLLSCFPNQRRLGIEPTNAAKIAMANGIPTEHHWWSECTAMRMSAIFGKAKLITCTNCFAHMPDMDDVMAGIKLMLADDGLFVSESHYLIDLIDKLQYDTIYAEHLRYYSISSLAHLFDRHGLFIHKVERIPTHGGSIRVYAGKHPSGKVFEYAELDVDLFWPKLKEFARNVQFNKTALLSLLHRIKGSGGTVAGIGAPSRASTVISYCGLDHSLIDYVYEQTGSLKIGRYMPGTDIPVVLETGWSLHGDQPDALVLFSWHLADELIPKIRAKGYRGWIILPCSATAVAAPAEAAA